MPRTPIKAADPGNPSEETEPFPLTDSELRLMEAALTSHVKDIEDFNDVNYETMAQRLGIQRKTVANRWAELRRKLLLRAGNPSTGPIKRKSTAAANGDPDTPTKKAKATPRKKTLPAAQDVPLPGDGDAHTATLEARTPLPTGVPMADMAADGGFGDENVPQTAETSAWVSQSDGYNSLY